MKYFLYWHVSSLFDERTKIGDERMKIGDERMKKVDEAEVNN